MNEPAKAKRISRNVKKQRDIYLKKLQSCTIKEEQNEDITIENHALTKSLLTEKLKIWCTQHKPSIQCLQELLDLLREEHLDVPHSAALFLQNKSVDASRLQSKIEEPLKKQFKDLENKIMCQNEVLLEALAEQKVLLESLTRQIHVVDRISQDFFPINSEEQLFEIEQKIENGSRDIVHAAIKHRLQWGVLNKFTDILSENIVMDFNLDGTHGKKRLRDFKEFHSVLLEAIQSVEGYENSAEKQLRRAFQHVKKRYLKHISAQKCKKKAMQKAGLNSEQNETNPFSADASNGELSNDPLN